MDMKTKNRWIICILAVMVMITGVYLEYNKAHSSLPCLNGRIGSTLEENELILDFVPGLTETRLCNERENPSEAIIRMRNQEKNTARGQLVLLLLCVIPIHIRMERSSLGMQCIRYVHKNDYIIRYMQKLDGRKRYNRFQIIGTC